MIDCYNNYIIKKEAITMENTAMTFNEMAQQILSKTVELDQGLYDLADKAILNAQNQYTNYTDAVEAMNQTGIGEMLELVKWCLVVNHTEKLEARQLEPVTMANMALQSAIRDYVEIVLQDTCRIGKDGYRVTTALTRNTLNKLA